MWELLVGSFGRLYEGLLSGNVPGEEQMYLANLFLIIIIPVGVDFWSFSL